MKAFKIGLFFILISILGSTSCQFYYSLTYPKHLNYFLDKPLDSLLLELYEVKKQHGIQYSRHAIGWKRAGNCQEIYSYLLYDTKQSPIYDKKGEVLNYGQYIVNRTNQYVYIGGYKIPIISELDERLALKRNYWPLPDYLWTLCQHIYLIKFYPNYLMKSWKIAIINDKKVIVNEWDTIPRFNRRNRKENW